MNITVALSRRWVGGVKAYFRCAVHSANVSLRSSNYEGPSRVLC